MALTACQPASLPRALDDRQQLPPTPAAAGLQVLRIEPPRLDGTGGSTHTPGLAERCRAWTLSAAQVRRFFVLSERYRERPYRGYYQLPCSISGVIEAEGRRWDYTIDAAATALWRSGGEVRHFGCVAPECAALVLLMPDGMDP